MKPLFIVRGARRLALALSLVVLACLSALSTAQAQVRPEVAEALMRQSGAWGQLGAVSPAVQSYLLAALQTDPSGESAKREDVLPVSVALQKAFAPDRLRASATQVVARQLSPAEAQGLSAWYASELGLQVSAIEAQVSETGRDPGERLRLGAAQLAALGPERHVLLSDVLAGTHAVSLQTEVLIQSLQAIHPGTSAFMPKAAKVSPKALRTRLEEQRKALQQGFQVAGMSLASGHYAALSDAQLQAYRDFLASPAGARLQALQRAGFVQALAEAVDEATRQLQGLQPAKR
jgi:hypothetical protein